MLFLGNIVDQRYRRDLDCRLLYQFSTVLMDDQGRSNTMRLRIGRPRPGGRRESARGLAHVKRLAVGVVLAATMGSAVTARAEGLVIKAPNITAAAGSTGSFDLLLVNT